MTNYTNLVEEKNKLDKRLDELGEHESNEMLYLNENVENLSNFIKLKHEYDKYYGKQQPSGSSCYLHRWHPVVKNR